MTSDDTLRLLLFSAQEQPLAPYTRLDVAFPAQIEVRVNHKEVKANYKGLKNKPGSTRPADITDLVKKRPGDRNQFEITYALTQKASQKEVF
jgi:E3 SUMO-protein ligase PIAS1